MFVVFRRSWSWWQVQRDPSGLGIVDDTAKGGWVPSGCLLETSVPPATATAETTALVSTQPGSQDAPSSLSQSSGRLFEFEGPILPYRIVSRNFVSIALMDWLPQGDYELCLVKDDVLRVFKKYNHWCYAVQENGKRGRVPSWLVGKMSPSSGTIPYTLMSGPQYDGNGKDATHALQSI
ncbi:Adaptor for signal transduction [Tulasnella sp. 332]|nr:Adaptor for signal transduction [Tulasnella sp. 332]